MNKASQTCVEVAVTLPVEGTFSYLVPAELTEFAMPGCGVTVPFKNRKVQGYILGPGELGIDGQLKEVLNVTDPEPLFPDSMVPFFKWISEYYIHPIGKVVQGALPAGFSRKVLREVRITERGLECLRNGEVAERGKQVLEALSDGTSKPLGYPLSTLRLLEAQGLITVTERTGRRVGPLMRTFVDMQEEGRGILSAVDIGTLRAKGEVEFLSIVQNGPVMLSDLQKRFANAGYLVKKWTKTGVLRSFKAPVYRAPEGLLFESPGAPRVLSHYQRDAIDKVKALIEGDKFSACLLYGITGSGKTEVYLEAVRLVTKLGKQAIVLVPEIALALYMESIFRTRLGERVAVYHSGLSIGERYDQWMKMARGEVDVVIGARSALFAPFSRLGLIVVDEEHDGAYKQDRAPYYHGRDAALARGRLENAVVILGSGTPSVQSYANCARGRYQLISMPERVENRQFPEIELVDMKEVEGQGVNRMLSPRLLEALDENLRQKKQTILFLNRRGFFRLFVCRFCGNILTCPNCNVSLIYHLDHNKLMCHYCGYHSAPAESCPACNRNGLKSWGFGTERLEHELADLFPGARVARMDADSARRKGVAQSTLKDFICHKIDILLGTQMITKGYDVPDVTLVGVIGADLSLGFPDFRAAERTFQLLSQVAGRAGRGGDRGRVIIQTYNPDHYAIQAAISQDYDALYQKEIELRKQLGFPPFTYLICLRLQGNSRDQTEGSAKSLAERLKKTLQMWPKKGKEIQILGPAEAPIAKLRGKYRWHILIKAKQPFLAQRLLQVARTNSEQGLKTKGVQIILDVDPYQMM